MYAKYTTGELTYRMFDGTNWGSEQTTSGAGMATNSVKQISSVSDTSNAPYVAYLSGGLSGTLKVARWTNTGTFQTFETADSSLSHSLPSMTVTSDNNIHIYTISGGKIYETRKGSIWGTPTLPFGSSFSSVNSLTSGYAETAALWTEGTSSFNLQFGIYPAFRPYKTQVATTSIVQSPGTTDYYEGENRVISAGAMLFAFYYDGSNIVYKSSSDNGVTWSSATSTGSGALSGADTYRWTVVSKKASNIVHIVILYQSLSGSNMNFYSKHGTFDTSTTGTTISWNSATTIFSPVNHDASGVYPASVAAVDSLGNIYAAFRWLPPGTSYVYAIYKSADNGLTWTPSLGSGSSPISASSGYRMPIVLMNGFDGYVLFAFARYEDSTLTYRTYSQSSGWTSTASTTGTPMTVNTIKQISAVSDSITSGHVIFLTGGVTGTPYDAWFNFAVSPPYVSSTQLSTMVSSLPSVTIVKFDLLRVYLISNSQIFAVDGLIGSSGVAWNTPENPFGTSFSSPNQLVTGFKTGAAQWLEGTNLYSGFQPFAHSYAGGYDSTAGPIRISQILGYTDFKGSSPADMVNHVLSEINTAGYSTSTNDVTTTLYQSIVRLDPDNSIRTDPQVWGQNGANLYNCFQNNQCPTLTSGSLLDYAYHTLFWSSATQVTFYVETHDISGIVHYNLTTYTKDLSDPSTNFAAGKLYVTSNPAQGNHTYKFLQFGVETDEDMLNWKVKQWGMVYYPVGGSPTSLDGQQVYEMSHNGLLGDQLTDSAVTYRTFSPTLHIPIFVGQNPGNFRGDYHAINGSVPSGTVTFWRGPPVIIPGSKLWP